MILQFGLNVAVRHGRLGLGLGTGLLKVIKRRSTNVVIHGLTEIVDTEKDARQKP